MKKISIVNVGAAPDAQREKYGDFEVWAKNAIESHYTRSKGQEFEILFHDGVSKPIPDLEGLAGVIIMGSLSMATEKAEWMLKLSTQIVELAEKEIPLLGICFGHQLIAQALGGEVGYNPKGLEIGTHEIITLDSAKRDPLFANLPTRFLAHTVHFQSVLTLPPNAVLLAHNDIEAHHAFRVGKCVWGVQFHPEFTPENMRLSLLGLKENVLTDFENKVRAISDTEQARLVLAQFTQYCLEL
jgi:GMP synthase (glutamine-hydrolysing)